MRPRPRWRLYRGWQVCWQQISSKRSIKNSFQGFSKRRRSYVSLEGRAESQRESIKAVISLIKRLWSVKWKNAKQQARKSKGRAQLISILFDDLWVPDKENYAMQGKIKKSAGFEGILLSLVDFASSKIPIFECRAPRSAIYQGPSKNQLPPSFPHIYLLLIYSPTHLFIQHELIYLLPGQRSDGCLCNGGQNRSRLCARWSLTGRRCLL